jgi:hypothetical protein
MLSEIFVLRLEAILRASNAAGSGSSDTRFVPIKQPLSPIRTRSKRANKRICRHESGPTGAGALEG